MNSFVKVIDNKLICIKENHNEQVEMVVMDEWVPLSDKFLCLKCFRSKRQITKNIIGVEEAQKLVEEKINQKNKQQEQSQQNYTEQLKNFIDRIRNHKQDIIKLFDEILRISDIWINSINQIGGKQDLSSLVQNIEILNDSNQYIKQMNDQLNKNNQSFYQKVQLILNKLMIQDEYKGCIEQLNKIIQNNQIIDKQIVQENNQDNKYKESINRTIQIQEIKQNSHEVKQITLINTVKQTESSCAIAFNQQGQIMIAGCKEDIKVWMFNKGQLIEQKRLKGHTNTISCLVYSQKYNWFFSGSYDDTIKCWKEQSNNNWVSSQPGMQHSRIVECLLLNKNEDQLISCSWDYSIIVWNVNYESNQLNYYYTLEYKHNREVWCISMNDSETYLVSCSYDKQIILWIKSQNQKWIYQKHILMDDFGYRIFFINENQIAWQQYSKGITHIFDIQNGQLIKRTDLNIELNQTSNADCDLFPTIYNKQRNIIIQKYQKYVYILKQQDNGKLMIQLQPIECKDNNNFGSLTNDGDYLVIWDYGTKEFKVYNIEYK